MLNRQRQSVDARLRYIVDLDDWLDVDETITSVEVEADDVILVESATPVMPDRRSYQFFLSGGAGGNYHRYSIRAVTSKNQKKVDNFEVYIDGKFVQLPGPEASSGEAWLRQRLTRAEYDALSDKNLDTLYYLTDEGTIYFGEDDLTNPFPASGWARWTGTRAAYDALGAYDPATIYFTSDTKEFFFGALESAVAELDTWARWAGTAAAYAAIVTKDNNTLYFTTDTRVLYRGSQRVGPQVFIDPAAPGGGDGVDGDVWLET